MDLQIVDIYDKEFIALISSKLKNNITYLNQLQKNISQILTNIPKLGLKVGAKSFAK